MDDLTSKNRGQENRRRAFLEQLLEIDASEVKVALNRAAMLLAQTLNADKVDVFLYDAATDTLNALGVSDTPMGRRQQALGLDRLPITNGGRTAAIYQTGNSAINGHVDQDPGELDKIKKELKLRSAIATPLVIGGQRRGVIQLDSEQEDFFTGEDLQFLEAIAHWVGIVVHRAEMSEQLAYKAREEGQRLAAENLMMVLAHDLNNYITPLKGRVDLIKRRAIREQRQQDAEEIEHINKTIQRFEGLITDLLDTSRLSLDLFTLSQQSVQLAALVEQITQSLEITTVPLRVQIPQDIILWADPQRLSQALENILINATKYAPENSYIEVKAQVAQDNSSAYISITDQGAGISPELLPHLFEPFQTGPHSTGLGLGLYLAERIANAHGGTLQVDTLFQEGTRFLLTIPLYKDHK